MIQKRRVPLDPNGSATDDHWDWVPITNKFWLKLPTEDPSSQAKKDALCVIYQFSIGNMINGERVIIQPRTDVRIKHIY